MNFLENIFTNLEGSAGRAVLQEARASGVVAATGGELRAHVEVARAFLRCAGMQKGDRCALLAHNSIRWAALNLAMVAEGVIGVPLYARQATKELAGMMRDAEPKLICAGDAALADAVRAEWGEAPRIALFDEVFGQSAGGETATGKKSQEEPAIGDAVAIIYTSGTSGEPKGVVLTAGNLSFMVQRTTERLNQLMAGHQGVESVFHYAPFCFAGSWILMLSCLSRNSLLTLSMDLSRLPAEMEIAAPHYFQNVPTLLERVRRSVEEGLAKRGGTVARLFSNARTSWYQKQAGTPGRFGWLWLGLAQAAVFPAIRKRIGKNLKALICGSAPLSRDTQLFFMMLGIQVLQVYGLTETTGICTMDVPGHAEPGWVGPAVDGVEMKVGEDQEILVRGPNVFPGYWRRPEETAKVLRDGWFHSGDQGEVNANGNWRIVGRIKNLLILNSGHNVAPEPIEEKLLSMMMGAQQTVLVGHGRRYLVAIVTGDLPSERVAAAIESLNREMPHYKQIHGFHIERQAFTIDSGLLTALGKLKRDAIGARYVAEIETMYREKGA